MAGTRPASRSWPGYMVAPTAEGVVKVYAANAEKASVETSLTNIYFGVNYYLDPRVGRS